jgi:hypothetical protein
MMTHREGDIVFIIDPARNPSEGDARDYFFNENDSSAKTSERVSSHIKTEVNLVKIAVQRDRYPQQAGVTKSKAYYADESLAIPCVKFGSGRNPFQQDCGLNLIIQHCKSEPISGKES